MNSTINKAHKQITSINGNYYQVTYNTDNGEWHMQNSDKDIIFEYKCPMIEVYDAAMKAIYEYEERYNG